MAAGPGSSVAMGVPFGKARPPSFIRIGVADEARASATPVVRERTRFFDDPAVHALGPARCRFPVAVPSHDAHRFSAGGAVDFKVVIDGRAESLDACAGAVLVPLGWMPRGFR